MRSARRSLPVWWQWQDLKKKEVWSDFELDVCDTIEVPPPRGLSHTLPLPHSHTPTRCKVESVSDVSHSAAAWTVALASTVTPEQQARLRTQSAGAMGGSAHGIAVLGKLASQGPMSIFTVTQTRKWVERVRDSARKRSHKKK